MPELPEVETVRRGLAPALVGRRIARVEVRRPDLRFPFPENFAERVSGKTVNALERRAKYLIAALSSGDDLIMHLGMTGRFTIVTGNEAHVPGQYVYDAQSDPRHDHVEMRLAGGSRVIYNDPRRFGFMLLIPAVEREFHPLFDGLGVEPLGSDLTPEYLARRAHAKKVNLKTLLMDQRIIAGLGNIYVSEALHRAGLSPNRVASSLSDAAGRPTERARRLVPAIKDVLAAALAAGGSTLRDYRQADGGSGSFQNEFAVYDREGNLCPRPGCGGQIKRVVHTGRATNFCGRCQR